MSRAGGVRAGRAFVELGVDDRAFRAGIRRAQRTISEFGKSAAAVGGVFTAVGTAGIGALTAAATRFASFGDEIQKTAARTGLAAETISELKFAAEQSGASLAQFEGSFRRLQKNIRDADNGLSTAVRAFDELGLSAAQLGALSPEDQFLAVAGALSEVEDPSRRAAIALDVFGRAGGQILPLINGGIGGIEELRQQARDLGLVLDQEAADKAAALTDSLNALRSSVRALVVNVGAQLAPAITDVATTLAESTQGAIRFVQENRGLVLGVAAVSVGLVALGGSLVTLGIAAGGASAALGLFGTVLLGVLSPVGLLTVAVGGLVAAGALAAAELTGASEALERSWVESSDAVGNAIDGIVTALGSGQIEVAAEIAASGFAVAFLNAIGEVSNALADFVQGYFDFVADFESILPAPLRALVDGTQSGIVAGIRGIGAGSGAQAGDLERRVEILQRLAEANAEQAEPPGQAPEDRLADAAQSIADELGAFRLPEQFVGPIAPEVAVAEEVAEAVRLSFSSVLASGLGVRGAFATFGGSRPDERAARAAEQSAATLERIDRNLTNGAAAITLG